MKPISKRQTITAALLAATAIPSVAAWSAPSHALAATAHKSTTKKYKGMVVDTRWTPVQAVISVKNKKITNVKIVTTIETARSRMIQSQAIPVLVSETLQSQSANIDQVSGATDIFDGYVQSLQSAIDKAKQAKALK